MSLKQCSNFETIIAIFGRVDELFKQTHLLVDVSGGNPLHTLKKYAFLTVSVLVGVEDIPSARVNPARYAGDYARAVVSV